MSHSNQHTDELWSSLDAAPDAARYLSLARLADRYQVDLAALPVTVRLLLENLSHLWARGAARESDVAALARWKSHSATKHEFPFLPSRVIMHDYTGIPAVVDLAALRDEAARLGGDPAAINPVIPADLIIDHSVQVDHFGTPEAYAANVDREYARNSERYTLLRWAQQAFANFRVVPPGTGIIHQVNMERLATVVTTQTDGSAHIMRAETLVGTDSHTTMINGLGVLGWGVGGIEAEAVMLGQPLYLLTPEVIGVALHGQLPPGTTATDLVLTVTQMLRQRGVVNTFVEFSGPGLSSLSLPDRATIANMSPEFGATATLFPVDAVTLQYLRATGRPDTLVDRIERFMRAQGLFHTAATPMPHFDDLLELDLSRIAPSVAGPRRPQDRVPLAAAPANFREHVLDRMSGEQAQRRADVAIAGETVALTHGSVGIAAITSCTNTSNPALMISAGLLAKHAVERGLTVNPAVKTSLAPGSRVVTDYLAAAGLLPYLEALRFNVVGYGCMTCIGNSGPLSEPVAAAVAEDDLALVAVLSGNRNFEGRINPQIRASYLASPPLVVAYALAGTFAIDLTREPLGVDRDGRPVYLRDIWPDPAEVARLLTEAMSPALFTAAYDQVFAGDARWHALPTPAGDQFVWDTASTYIQEPPFVKHITPQPESIAPIMNARALVMVGDSITTDHISPAGSIPAPGPAGAYLQAHGVAPRDFNNFGARRGNHEVMARGTYGNIRLRNELAPGREGGWTRYLPENAVMPIYDAAQRYQADGVPLLVIAGKEYGTGSSRDWAAKGTLLLGIRAVLAESFERIHRSNLIGMGVLPLQFQPGESRQTLGLDGEESFTIDLAADLQPGQIIPVRYITTAGERRELGAILRLDSQIEVDYYRHGGLLPYILRQHIPALAGQPIQTVAP